MDQGVEWHFVTHYLPALRAAARADANTAIGLARIANREGQPIANDLFKDFIVWDLVRDAPGFDQLMAEVRERQAELLAEVRQVATWDPRDADGLEGIDP